MSVEPTVFVDLIVAVFILGATLITVVIAYARVLSRFHTIEKEEGELKSELSKEERKSASLQNESHEEVQAAFRDSMLSKKDEIEKLSSDFLQAFRESLRTLQDEHIKRIKSISESIETDALSEVKDFKTVLQKETVASQKIVEQKIEEEYKKAQDDVALYKKEELSKIDTAIYDMLQVVAKEVLGKTLSLGEHETLVTEALEKAKNEGMFKKRTNGVILNGVKDLH